MSFVSNQIARLKACLAGTDSEYGTSSTIKNATLNGTTATLSATTTNITGTLNLTSQPVPAAGLGGNSIRIPLFTGRNSSYTSLDATGSASLWKFAGTVGTATNLQTAGAQNNTKTGVGLWEFVVPNFYKAAANLTLTANVQRVVASGTSLTTKIDAEVFLMGDDGTAGSDICATAEITFTDTSAADKTFTITGTSLTAGARLLIRMTGTATEGGNAGTVVTQLNSLRIS